MAVDVDEVAYLSTSEDPGVTAPMVDEGKVGQLRHRRTHKLTKADRAKLAKGARKAARGEATSRPEGRDTLVLASPTPLPAASCRAVPPLKALDGSRRLRQHLAPLSGPSRRYGSPFHGLAIGEESSGGAIVGQGGEPYGCVGTLFDGA